MTQPISPIETGRHTPPGMTEINPAFLPENIASGVTDPKYKENIGRIVETLSRISDDKALHGLLKRHPQEGTVTIKSGHTYSSDAFELQMAADRKEPFVEIAVEYVSGDGRTADVGFDKAAMLMASNRIHWYHVEEAVRHRKRQMVAREMKPRYEAVIEAYDPGAQANERKKSMMDYLDVLSTDRNLYDLLTEPTLSGPKQEGGEPGWSRMTVEFRHPENWPSYTMHITPRKDVPAGDERLLDIRFLRTDEDGGASKPRMREFDSREQAVVEIMNATGVNLLSFKERVDGRWHEKWQGYEQFIRQREMKDIPGLN
ncbi:MAG: hypothetical protein ABIH11_00050 [Candidatus Altiarchaeota archaeon]